MPTTGYINLPVLGGSTSSVWKGVVSSASSLPALGNTQGDVRQTLDTLTLYTWSGSAWVAIATPGAAIALDGLIGDGTASGPGVAILTLATVNANVGSFTLASITVNAKGLVTAASSSSVGNLTDVGTDGIVVTGGTGAVIGAGTSIAQHVADSTHNGYLSSTDWSVFSAKGSVSSVAMSVPAFLSVSGSPITSSGTLALTLSGTALPIANGGTGVTSVTTAPTASSFAGWDANKNLSANSFVPGFTSTATAAGTTTLTVASTEDQYFTGTNTQTVVLPVASTLVSGQKYKIVNLSTLAITVQTSGSVVLQIMAGGSTAFIDCSDSAGGTGIASWTVNYSSAGVNPTAWAFGSGSAGDVTISSGTTNNFADAYYRNLTINGSGKLNTNQTRIFVSGTLDLTGAAAGAINNNGSLSGAANNGSNTGAGGGSLGGANDRTLGGSSVSASGGASTATNGNNANTFSSPTIANGGAGGAGGNGGTGSGGTAGTGASSISPNTGTSINRYAVDMIRGVTLIGSGVTGSGGGGGSGDGTAGGGGGGAAQPGQTVYIAANNIKTSGGAVGSIASIGGAGGNGGTPAAGTRGGGGGAGGSGGGWVYIVYANKMDAAATGLIDVSGGASGVGGNGTNSGTSGGASGGGGASGRVTLFNVRTGVGSETAPGTVTTGNAASGSTGGASVAGRISQVDF